MPGKQVVVRNCASWIGFNFTNHVSLEICDIYDVLNVGPDRRTYKQTSKSKSVIVVVLIVISY